MKDIFNIKNKINEKLAENQVIFKLNINEIKIVDELAKVFTIDKEVENRICADIRENGFSKSHPVHVWFYNGNWCLVDGHTRFHAAVDAGCDTIWAQAHNFKNMNEAILFSNKEQFNRRQVVDSELFARFLALKDENKTEQEISDDLQKSKRTVSKMAEILKKATQDKIKAIKNGEISINKVYNDIKKAEAEEAEKLSEKDRMENENASVADKFPSAEELQAQLEQEKQEKTLKKQRSLDAKELKLREKELALQKERRDIFVFGLKIALAMREQDADASKILEDSRIKNFKSVDDFKLSENERIFIEKLTS